MPNWCHTNMFVSGSKEDIQKFRNFVYKDEEQILDFNKIIPEPDELKKVIYNCSLKSDMELVKKEEAGQILTEEEKVQLDKELKDELESTYKVSVRDNAKLAIQCFEKYGYKNWYEWQIFHWGTKWNACEAVIISEESDTIFCISFLTPWDRATPVFKKMSEIFPTLKFCFKSSIEDEDISETYKKGTLVKSSMKKIHY